MNSYTTLSNRFQKVNSIKNLDSRYNSLQDLLDDIDFQPVIREDIPQVMLLRGLVFNALRTVEARKPDLTYDLPKQFIADTQEIDELHPDYFVHQQQAIREKAL